MKHLCIIFFVCTLCIACKNQTSIEQQLKFSIEKLSELNKNKVSDTLILRGALDSAYQVALEVSNLQHDSLFAVVSRSYGNTFYYNEPHKAISIYRKGLSIGLRQLPPTDYAIALLYKTTAQIYYIQDDYKTALTYFDSVKINAQTPKFQNVKLDLMTMIAECYTNLNDQISAVQMMSEVEPIAQKLYAPHQLGLFYTNFARYLRLQKKLNDAIQKIKLGEVVLQKLRKDQALTATDSLVWANNAFGKAHILHDSKDFHNSEFYYLQALQIYDKTDNHYNYQIALKNLGDMYFLANQFDKGEAMLTKSLKLCNQSELDDATLRLKVDLYQNRSKIYIKTKQYAKAIADFDSVIHQFNKYSEKPALTALKSPILIPVLKDKLMAYVALADNGSDSEGYTKALQLTREIIALADDIRADYFSDDAKLTLANDAKPAFEKAISVCQKLYQKTGDRQYLEKAFDFVEYSRSMVLYENARLDNQLPPDLKAEKQYRRFAKLPPTETPI
jgi:tetratricopeptide (TPR) repeat protein